MTLRRSVLAALCACGAVASLPASASATVPSRAAFVVSPGGKSALAKRSLVVRSAPRGPSSYPTFAIAGWTVGASASIRLDGSLRFSAGRRTVDATGLTVTIGRTASFVSAKLNAKTGVRLFAVTPSKPAVLDAAGNTASLVGARFALTKAAAAKLKSALKLKRTPPTGTLGRLTVGVAPPARPLPAPAPAPPAALPAPAPAATPTPAPSPACADRFAATPAGSVDWFGCDLPGNGDLHSWTDYIQRPFAALPGCGSAPGTVAASDGAERLETAYDHRFPVTSSGTQPDGSTAVVVRGRVTYTMPAHGIDEQIGALRIVIAADGRSGTVFASGHAKPRDMSGGVCATAAEDYADQPVLTLDLTGITPVTAGGVTRWVHVPARIAAGDRIGGGVYGDGAAWGAFTIALPAR